MKKNTNLGVVGITDGLITSGHPSQFGFPSTSFLTGQTGRLPQKSLPKIGGYYA